MAYGNNYNGYGYYGGAQGMNTAPVFQSQNSQMMQSVRRLTSMTRQKPRRTAPKYCGRILTTERATVSFPTL